MITILINKKKTLGLGLGIPNRDRHFVKQLESMQPTGIGYKIEHKQLKELMKHNQKDHLLLHWTIISLIMSSIQPFNNYK